jgi:hypothetical protein
MFMPAIIKSQTGASDLGASLIAGGYYTIAAVAMLINGWHSDHVGERIWHVCVPLAIQGTGIFLAATFDAVPIVPFVIVLMFVATTHYTHLPAFWPIPSIFLGAIAAASAIGFINMTGNLGGYFGPKWVGTAVTEDIKWLKQFMETTRRDNRFVDKQRGTELLTELEKATSVNEIRNIRAEATSAGQALAQKEADRIASIERNVEDGRKLSAEKTLEVVRLMNAAVLRVELTEPQVQQMFALLTQGASFAAGLKRLAPWPIMSATIILVVGYFRRRAAITSTA